MNGRQVLSKPTIGNYSTYGGKLKDEIEGKYKSIYASNNGGSNPNYNYSENANVNRKGEAIWETSNEGNDAHASWNLDYAGFVHSSSPFVLRSGYWNLTTGAGVFAFSRHTGLCDYSVSFRPVLVCK